MEQAKAKSTLNQNKKCRIISATKNSPGTVAVLFFAFVGIADIARRTLNLALCIFDWSMPAIAIPIFCSKTATFATKHVF